MPTHHRADYSGRLRPPIYPDPMRSHGFHQSFRSLLNGKTTYRAKAVIAHLGADLPGKVIALSNGGQTAQAGITIEAIPCTTSPPIQTTRVTKRPRQWLRTDHRRQKALYLR